MLLGDTLDYYDTFFSDVRSHYHFQIVYIQGWVKKFMFVA